MTRLIDADKLQYFRCTDNKCDSDYDVKCQTCNYGVIYKHNIDNAPTVPLPDFKEGYKQAIKDGKTNFSRPQGKWIKTNDYVTCAYGCIDYVKCSCCKNDSLEEGDYCPNCGADMREADDEQE